jgi:DNA-binding response OmpR family regulator
MRVLVVEGDPRTALRARGETPRRDASAVGRDPATHGAARGTRTIEVTTQGFVVLEYLMRNAGRVLSREQIREHAWDANYDPLSNVVDVYVSRVRKKIDGSGDPPLITTVRGAGYRLGGRENS